MLGRGWVLLILPGLLAWPGCKVGPKNFFSLTNAAPHVRSRAVTLGDALPESVAVPALIDRLEDTDSVVRLSAHETLKRRTGQDLGFVPWADPATRGRAVARWRAWWGARQAGQPAVSVSAPVPAPPSRAK